MAANETKGVTIESFSGNLSEKELGIASMYSLFGPLGTNAGEMVKFKAPKPGWALNEISILAYDGFNGTRESVPRDGIIALEIRDKNLNLLYRYVDSFIPYSNYVYNVTRSKWMNFEVPSIPVSDEFYIAFYDRGNVAVVTEFNVTGDSYIFDRPVKNPIPAKLPTSANQTAPVNWIMAVTGS